MTPDLKAAVDTIERMPGVTSVVIDSPGPGVIRVTVWTRHVANVPPDQHDRVETLLREHLPIYVHFTVRWRMGAERDGVRADRGS